MNQHLYLVIFCKRTSQVDILRYAEVVLHKLSLRKSMHHCHMFMHYSGLHIFYHSDLEFHFNRNYHRLSLRKNNTHHCHMFMHYLGVHVSTNVWACDSCFYCSDLEILLIEIIVNNFRIILW